jgi:uncharacterized protein HemX
VIALPIGNKELNCFAIRQKLPYPAHMSEQVIPAPRKSRLLLLLLVLIVSGTVAYLTWRVQQYFDQSRNPRHEANAATAPATPAAVATGATSSPGEALSSAVQTQIDDLRRVNMVLREQVAALTQRVRVMQEQHAAHAIAEDANSVPFALAEQWLALAQGRWDLYADPRGALRALEFADVALMQSNDPATVSLRQTLMIEINAMRSHSLADPELSAARLGSIADAIKQWPLKGAAQGEASARWYERLLVVRRTSSDAGAPPSVDSIRARLFWLRQQLARGDWQDLAREVAGISADIEQHFDANDAAVREGLDSIQGLSEVLDRGQRVQLGSTLRELRALLGQGDTGNSDVAPDSTTDAAMPQSTGEQGSAVEPSLPTEDHSASEAPSESVAPEQAPSAVELEPQP